MVMMVTYGCGLRAPSTRDAHLEEFEVEVADVVEEEGVQGGRGAAERVLLDLAVALDDGGVEAREDEEVALGHGRVRRQLLVDALRGLEVGNVGEREAHGVPQFVAELTVAHDALDVEVHVSPCSATVEDRRGWLGVRGIQAGQGEGALGAHLARCKPVGRSATRLRRTPGCLRGSRPPGPPWLFRPGKTRERGTGGGGINDKEA